MDHQVTISQLNAHVVRHELAAWFYQTESKVLTAIIQFIDGEVYASYEVYKSGEKIALYPTLLEALEVYNSI